MRPLKRFGMHLEFFLNDDSTFNKGIIEDYKSFDALEESVFQDTALADFINGSKLSDEFVPAINVGPTNNDQIKATQNALSSSVSVITGPPGTGKSQTIASVTTSTLLNGWLSSFCVQKPPSFRCSHRAAF